MRQVRNRLRKKKLSGSPNVVTKKTLTAMFIDHPAIWHHQYLDIFLNILFANLSTSFLR